MLQLAIFAVGLFAHNIYEHRLPFAWEQRFTQTAPPLAPVRPIAEFEPSSKVIIRFPLGIPLNLVVQLSQEAQVVCLVSSSQQSSANSQFTNAGVNMANVSFLNTQTDSYWTRDYSPWFIYDGNGDMAVVDFRYNRPRPLDDQISQLYATHYGLPYYGMNLYQTGGNYMTDGINTAAQSHIAYTENSNNQSNVNNLMQQFLGITSYHVLQDPNNTYIDHIDCWGKFLAPDKILIRSVPSTHAQYNALEATANYFANQLCAWGYPYKVYRVNTPQNQPYSNSLILNNKVFVPITNSAYDQPALQAYRDAMPGYEVIGVPGAPYTPWESTDALHCRTHEVPDENMLHIAHQPYHGLQNPRSSYAIHSEIVAYSGMDLIADSLYVNYRVNGGEWQQSPLINTYSIHWQTSLSGFAAGDSIAYYIHALDASGRSRNHPQFAALEPHYFIVYGDSTPPSISHNAVEYAGESALTFIVQVEDSSPVALVELYYKVDEAEAIVEPMFDMGNGLYLCSVNIDFGGNAQSFYYQIRAEDVNGNIGYWPSAEAWQYIDISPNAVADFQQMPKAPKVSVWPNPARRGGEIKISLESESKENYKISIYNVRGQLVRELSNQVSGRTVGWDGKDFGGRTMGSGLYLIKISGESYQRKHKLLML